MCLKSFLSIIKMLFIYFCTLDEKTPEDYFEKRLLYTSLLDTTYCECVIPCIYGCWWSIANCET